MFFRKRARNLIGSLINTEFVRVWLSLDSCDNWLTIAHISRLPGIFRPGEGITPTPPISHLFTPGLTSIIEFHRADQGRFVRYHYNPTVS